MRRCAASIHDDTVPFKHLNSIKYGKRIRKARLRALLNSGIIKKNTNYICNNCLDATASIEESATQSSNGDGESGEQTTQRPYVSFHKVGGVLSQSIQSDVSALYNDKEKSDIKTLESYNAKTWLAERPKEFMELLMSMCGMSYFADIDDDQAVRIAKIVEQIYSCHNSKLTLPLAFCENLLKMGRNNINGVSVEPGESGKFPTKWLGEQI